ncbi:hypothetical protein IT084_13295 [Desulfallas sp. Bu1-1]|uniref:hypothetical protein n=1 Tax=Desulfallas sp. Bu1-1 TaxID=2787620 RepID=UPI00189FAEFF|nr:hypothetical protein [Desulfallas sp. Bu1-1]MBF7083945.1 hypothetical protein [Desulfallas sp. Bu1-1]
MKKKLMVVIISVFLIALVAPGAFAAINNNQNYFDSMFDAHKQWVKQAMENKQITPEQGKAWEQHFDYMRQFHQENGYICPGPGMMGGGMMGWGWNSGNGNIQ